MGFKLCGWTRIQIAGADTAPDSNREDHPLSVPPTSDQKENLAHR